MKSFSSEPSIKNQLKSQIIFKVQLTEMQVRYLNELLPQNYSLKNFQPGDQKRIRTPKKTDEIYETNFKKKTKEDPKKVSVKSIKEHTKNEESQKQKLKISKEKIDAETRKEEKKDKKTKSEKNESLRMIEEQIMERRQQVVEEIQDIKPQNTFSKKQFCLIFLKKLKSHKSAWPFRQPVDPIGQGVPNYPDVVKEPMDLKTIEKKLNSHKYQHISEFHGDINKIFLNSYKFNPRETQYYTLTLELEAYYNQLVKETEKNPMILDHQQKNRKPKTEQDFINEEEIKKKKQTMVKQTKEKTVDRKELTKKILSLSSAGIGEVLYAIYQSEGKQIDDSQMSFNIEIEKLKEKTIDELDSYLKKYEEDQKNRYNNSKTELELF